MRIRDRIVSALLLGACVSLPASAQEPDQTMPPDGPTPDTSPSPASRVASWNVILTDDFNDGATGVMARGSENPTRWSAGYADGEYSIKTLAGGFGIAGVPREIRNAAIVIDARILGDVADRFVSASCRRQPNLSQYRFDVDVERGRSRLTRIDGSNFVDLVPWRVAAAIRTGNETNRLGLSCDGVTISASANGVEVLRVDDTTYPSGQVAFAAGAFGGNQTEGRFDNLVVTADVTPSVPAIFGQEIRFRNGDLMLQGFLFKPEGEGPFPALVHNHGSEQNPGPTTAFSKLFVDQGYVVLRPIRRGHGLSEGLYIGDQKAQTIQSGGRAAWENQIVPLHEAQVADQLAGFSYAAVLPYVDAARIGVIGWSYGGMQAILGAEANAGYRVAVACAANAQEQSSSMRARLVSAVSRIMIPLLVFQAQNDRDTSTTGAIGAEIGRLGKSGRAIIYPAFGNNSDDAHAICSRGADVWAPDVFPFLDASLR